MASEDESDSENSSTSSVSIDYEELERRKEKIRDKLKNLLGTDASKKFRKILITKAFIKWSRLFPLHQKCDELYRILQERMQLLDSLRTSYLKDIICVKHVVETTRSANIIRESLGPTAVISDELLDLQAVPSGNIRPLIESAMYHPAKASIQFRDTLISAGIYNPSTGRTYNPWEESKAFRKVLKQQKGMSFELPNTDGEALQLAKPSTHKIYIRECKECIGVVGIIRTWNKETEEALRLFDQSKNFDVHLRDLKNTIDSLNVIIGTQEREIARLESKNHEIEATNTWFDKWAFMKDGEERENRLNELVSNLKNSLLMAEEEKRSALIRQSDDMSEWVEEMKDSEQRARLSLEHCRKELDIEKQRNYELESKVSKLNQNIGELSDKNRRLSDEVERSMDTQRQLQSKIVYLSNMEKELLRAVEIKESNFQKLQAESNAQIENLQAQAKQLSEEYSEKEALVDGLRDTIKDLKSSLVAKSEEVEKKSEEAAKVAETLQQAKGNRFRVYAHCVILSLRIMKAIRTQSYEHLGLYKYKILGKSLISQMRFMESSMNAQKQQLIELREANDALKEEDSKRQDAIDVLSANLKAANSEMNALQSQISENSEKIEKMETSTAKEQENISGLVQQFVVRQRRMWVYVQMQRSLLQEALASIAFMRSVINVVNPDQLYPESEVPTVKQRLLAIAAESDNGQQEVKTKSYLDVIKGVTESGNGAENNDSRVDSGRGNVIAMEDKEAIGNEVGSVKSGRSKRSQSDNNSDRSSSDSNSSDSSSEDSERSESESDAADGKSARSSRRNSRAKKNGSLSIKNGSEEDKEGEEDKDAECVRVTAAAKKTRMKELLGRFRKANETLLEFCRRMHQFKFVSPYLVDRFKTKFMRPKIGDSLVSTAMSMMECEVLPKDFMQGFRQNASQMKSICKAAIGDVRRVEFMAMRMRENHVIVMENMQTQQDTITTLEKRIHRLKKKVMLAEMKMKDMEEKHRRARKAQRLSNRSPSANDQSANNEFAPISNNETVNNALLSLFKSHEHDKDEASEASDSFGAISSPKFVVFKERERKERRRSSIMKILNRPNHNNAGLGGIQAGDAATTSTAGSPTGHSPSDIYNSLLMNTVSTGSPDSAKRSPHALSDMFEIVEDEDHEFKDDEEMQFIEKEFLSLQTKVVTLENETKEGKEHETQLRFEVTNLQNTIHTMEQREEELREEHELTLEALNDRKREIERVSYQNQLLRESIEDSYRKHSKEKEKLLFDNYQEKLKDETERLSRRKNRGTQISCSVCAVRSVFTQGLDGYGAVDCNSVVNNSVGVLSFHDDNVSEYYDQPNAFNDDYRNTTINRRIEDSSPMIPMVNQTLTNMLDGAVILTARPRNINKASLRSSKSQSQVTAVTNVNASQTTFEDRNTNNNSSSNNITSSNIITNPIVPRVSIKLNESTTKSMELNSPSDVNNSNTLQNRSVSDNNFGSIYNSNYINIFDEALHESIALDKDRPVTSMSSSMRLDSDGHNHTNTNTNTIAMDTQVQSNPILNKVIRPKSAYSFTNIHQSGSIAGPLRDTSEVSKEVNIPQEWIQPSNRNGSKFRILKNIPDNSNMSSSNHVGLSHSTSANTVGNSKNTLQKKRSMANTAAYLQRKILEEQVGMH